MEDVTFTFQSHKSYPDDPYTFKRSRSKVTESVQKSVKTDEDNCITSMITQLIIRLAHVGYIS